MAGQLHELLASLAARCRVRILIFVLFYAR